MLKMLRTLSLEKVNAVDAKAGGGLLIVKKSREAMLMAMEFSMPLERRPKR